MNYKHPSIVIDQPAAGHYVIYGHHPQPARNEEGQTVVPLQQCYITPEVPSDALIAILEERGGAALLEYGLSAQRNSAEQPLVALSSEGALENHGEKLGRNGDSHGCRSRVTGRRDVAIASALRRCPSGPAGAGAISLRSVPVEIPPGLPGSSLAASSRKAAKKGGRK